MRVIGAANVDLPSLARSGAFRADLLDRLAFEVVTIPPLRARPADIIVLANAFAVDIVRALGKDVFPGFGPQAETALLAHAWPGNVRELRNVVRPRRHAVTIGFVYHRASDTIRRRSDASF